MATAPQKSRKQRALSVLETQLSNSVKTEKGTTDVKIPLTEADVKRIKKGIEILKTRV